MIWSETIFIAGCLVGSFMAGVYYGEMRSGGVPIKELIPHNFGNERPMLTYGQNPLERQVNPRRCSPTAAAHDITTERNRRNIRPSPEMDDSGCISANGCNSLPVACNTRARQGVFLMGLDQRASGLALALTLLWKAESGCGENVSGEGGQARGHLQFHEATWNDSLSLLGLRDNLSWQWPLTANDLWRCYVVAIANWQEYAPQAVKDGNIEMLLRVHRLPSAPFRADNEAYVNRVLNEN